jgi:hypothetical protein
MKWVPSNEFLLYQPTILHMMGYIPNQMWNADYPQLNSLTFISHTLQQTVHSLVMGTFKQDVVFGKVLSSMWCLGTLLIHVTIRWFMCDCQVIQPQTEKIVSLLCSESMQDCQCCHTPFLVPLCTTGTHHAHTYLHGRLWVWQHLGHPGEQNCKSL